MVALWGTNLFLCSSVHAYPVDRDRDYTFGGFQRRCKFREREELEESAQIQRERRAKERREGKRKR
jgi:hypothetical protein